MSSPNSKQAIARHLVPSRATVVAMLVFVAKWTVAGLAFAGVLVWLRPDLATNSSSIIAPAPPAPVALPRPPVAKPVVAPIPPAVLQPTSGYAEAVAKSAPSVVYIYTAREVIERVRPQMLDRLLGNTSPALRRRVEGSLGSGVIVDAQGHVVTNHHVIAKAQQIGLQLADGRVTSANLVGDDPDSDLALLKIELPRLPVMPMGRSDRLRVGDIALAIGYPYGLSQSVTHGIISATGRDELGVTQFDSFIQTDAAINIGNSGGALVNAQGELIGINTAVLGQASGSEGIGFAIPVNMVRGVVEQIIKHGRVRRGWLGATWRTLTPQRAARVGLAGVSGVEILEIVDNAAAARAGLLPGDVMTALNGTQIRDERDATNRVAGLKPGSQLRIQGRRAQETFDVRVTIDERKAE